VGRQAGRWVGRQAGRWVGRQAGRWVGREGPWRTLDTAHRLLWFPALLDAHGLAIRVHFRVQCAVHALGESRGRGALRREGSSCRRCAGLGWCRRGRLGPERHHSLCSSGNGLGAGESVAAQERTRRRGPRAGERGGHCWRVLDGGVWRSLVGRWKIDEGACLVIHKSALHGRKIERGTVLRRAGRCKASETNHVHACLLIPGPRCMFTITYRIRGEGCARGYNTPSPAVEATQQHNEYYRNVIDFCSPTRPHNSGQPKNKYTCLIIRIRFIHMLRSHNRPISKGYMPRFMATCAHGTR
jgi:hypothetical protein